MLTRNWPFLAHVGDMLHILGSKTYSHIYIMHVAVAMAMAIFEATAGSSGCDGGSGNGNV